jgi:urease gamma subunit
MRVSLALRAAREGYAMAEVFDVGDPLVKDEAVFAALEELAGRIDAQAVVIAGRVDRARVHDIADRVRLMVLELPATV